MYMGEKYKHTKPTASYYVRCLFWCTASIFPITAFTQVSVQLPSTITGNARDRIVTPERFECEMSLSGKAQLEYGLAASNTIQPNSFVTNPDPGKNVTVYGKLVIPIGAPKSRIDCNILYEMEIRRRELEIKLLEMQTNPDNFRPAVVPNVPVQNPSGATSSSGR